jgi:hypothetical protein
MQISRDWLVGAIARVMIVALMSSITYAAPQAQASPGNEPSGTDKVPDSPGALQTQSQGNSNQQLSGQQQLVPGDSPSAQSANQQSVTAQNEAQPANSASTSQAPEPHQPLGTAAAESIPTMGIAASQPAGAAVAPAKQRRVRTILIRVGAIVAGAAAVGAVVALSEGSPSRPPGAH